MAPRREWHDPPCPDCGAEPELRVCTCCGAQGRLVDCGHEDRPRPVDESLYGLGLTCEDCERWLG